VPEGWRLAPLAATDCDELGRVHMAVSREAYAGIMPADYLAGLSVENCAARWRTIASAPPPEGGTRARAFYERRGFADDGSRTEHEPTGTTEIRMVRRTGS
jgi:hypothetical protein